MIGLYLLAVNAALSAFSGDVERGFLWGIFVVFTLAVIGFLHTRKVRRRQQIAVSVAAFVAWVMASPGPFQAIEGYPEVLGTFALLTVVLAAVVFRWTPIAQGGARELGALSPTAKPRRVELVGE